MGTRKQTDHDKMTKEQNMVPRPNEIEQEERQQDMDRKKDGNQDREKDTRVRTVTSKCEDDTRRSKINSNASMGHAPLCFGQG